jgi:hypothetical protein
VGVALRAFAFFLLELGMHVNRRLERAMGK